MVNLSKPRNSDLFLVEVTYTHSELQCVVPANRASNSASLLRGSEFQSAVTFLSSNRGTTFCSPKSGMFLGFKHHIDFRSGPVKVSTSPPPLFFRCALYKNKVINIDFQLRPTCPSNAYLPVEDPHKDSPTFQSISGMDCSLEEHALVWEYPCRIFHFVSVIDRGPPSHRVLVSHAKDTRFSLQDAHTAATTLIRQRPPDDNCLATGLIVIEPLPSSMSLCCVLTLSTGVSSHVTVLHSLGGVGGVVDGDGDLITIKFIQLIWRSPLRSNVPNSMSADAPPLMYIAVDVVTPLAFISMFFLAAMTAPILDGVTLSLVRLLATARLCVILSPSLMFFSPVDPSAFPLTNFQLAGAFWNRTHCMRGETYRSTPPTPPRTSDRGSCCLQTATLVIWDMSPWTVPFDLALLFCVPVVRVAFLGRAYSFSGACADSPRVTNLEDFSLGERHFQAALWTSSLPSLSRNADGAGHCFHECPSSAS
ncbi:hypothetical protein Tco_0238231 [Tanacetum coccineum]